MIWSELVVPILQSQQQDDGIVSLEVTLPSFIVDFNVDFWRFCDPVLDQHNIDTGGRGQIYHFSSHSDHFSTFFSKDYRS